MNQFLSAMWEKVEVELEEKIEKGQWVSEHKIMSEKFQQGNNGQVEGGGKCELARWSLSFSREEGCRGQAPAQKQQVRPPTQQSPLHPDALPHHQPNKPLPPC